MNIIICEDNSLYLNKIYNISYEFLKNNNISGSVKAFNTYTNTINYIKTLPDYTNLLYILDIDLGSEKNGIVLGREIRQLDKYKGEMIFVTAYTHQMSNVFKYKLKVLDFIDKGFNLEKDLLDSLKAYSYINKSSLSHEKLSIKDGIKTYNIDPNDIILVETDKSSKKIIITCSCKVITARITLKEFLKLSPKFFMQIHRCCVVNTKHITKMAYENKILFLSLTNDNKQAVSKRREKQVKECTTLSL